jgi:hypothetical protein
MVERIYLSKDDSEEFCDWIGFLTQKGVPSHTGDYDECYLRMLNEWTNEELSFYHESVVREAAFSFWTAERDNIPKIIFR